MTDRHALDMPIGNGWKLTAAGPRRRQSGEVEVDLILENGRPIFASRAVINVVESRTKWAAQATSDGRPSADTIASAMLDLLPSILAVLQDPARPSQADGLVNIVNELSNDLEGGIELWRDQNDDAWASIAINGHREHWLVNSRVFKRYLAQTYFDKNQKVPNDPSLRDAITVVSGTAQFSGPEYQVFTRVAQHNGCIYLDLADDQWRVVEIRPDGWNIVTKPPVRFRRAAGMSPLPEPVRGGSLDLIFQYVNVVKEDRVLIEALLADYLSPTGPYPVCCFFGEQGAAKSTAARAMRSIVDPNISPLRAEPRNVRDLLIAATNGAIVVLDNVSKLRDWLSDAICRVSTGGGLSTRALYTDGEEIIFEVQRPVIITAIEDVAVRGDLLDRAIPLTLPRIPEGERKTERAFWAQFAQDHPRILGALLDRASNALRDVDTVELGQLPRMADFAQWAYASLPIDKRDQFIQRYAQNRETANETVIANSHVANAVLDFMSSLQSDDYQPAESWFGTWYGLLDALNKVAGESVQKSKDWPATPRGMSGAVRRLAPNLKFAGVLVDFDPKPAREAGTGRTNVRIERVATRNSQSSQTHSPSQDPWVNAENVCDQCGSDCEDCECDREDTNQQSQATFTDEIAETPAYSSESEDCEDCEDLEVPF